MGFKIDAVAHLRPIVRSGVVRHLQMNNLAEIYLPRHRKATKRNAGLSLMGWILKREVRAFGGCLGMYRR